MNWLSLIPSIITLIGEIPAIKSAFDSVATGGIQAVAAVVQKSPLAGTLADIGGQLFPKLSPELHAAAAALVIAHPNNTSWLQSALNVLSSTGYITLAAPLVVDGIYGPKTTAALELIQQKLGLPVNGMMVDAEYNAIAALLAKV